MQNKSREPKCLKVEPVYESRFPLYQWRIDCWAQTRPGSRKFKAYKLVYAETYREAVSKADTWEPLIISVTRVSNQLNQVI